MVSATEIISSSRLSSTCRIASAHDSVLNSECAFTFHNPYTSPAGIVVNLSTFIATIDELALANESQGIFVRIVKNRVPKKETSEKEVTKLGIGIDGGFQDDKFDVISKYSVVLLEKTDGAVAVVAESPFETSTKNGFPMNVISSVESIIHHAGVAVQQDLKAFELDEEKPVSKYAKSLEFVDNGVKVSPNPADWKCEKTGDTRNLWLNLSTGFIGGGRKNWDGSGGSNGALEYFLEAGENYPLVVKLGTITEDIETADCYSYAKDEDGPVRIPNLAELLEKRGVNVSGMKKTVKSTAELEVELNATYAFDAITESGAKLVPVSGPGLQGLQNLGNSCYINSVVQMLLSGTIPELASRYGTEANGDIHQHPLLKVSSTEAPTDLLAQTAKLGCALTSGVFAMLEPPAEVTDEMSSSNDPKYRIPPRMFKHVVGKDHVDFCTGQQQDAAQFLQYLIEKIDRAEAGAGARLTNKSDGSSDVPKTSGLFAYETTSRLVCSQDGKVKYKDNQPEIVLSLRVPMDKGEIVVKPSSSTDSEPEEKKQKAEEEIPTVTFQACIDTWAEPHTIDGVRWSHLNNSAATAMEETKFANFPRYMMVQIQRYELGPDWTPRKLEVNIDVTDEIDFSSLRSTGPQHGEDIVPDEAEGVNGVEALAQPQVTVNEGAVAQLMDMGFGMNGCIRALSAVGGSNVDLAMNWIFEHNNDPDFNDPLPEPGSAGSSAPTDSGVDEEVVSSLVENLGCFTADQVRAALKECSGAADRAADWLFSHMDDLDGAISRLSTNSTSVAAPPASTSPLEDGEGKYKLVGLVSHIGKNTGSGHYVAHLKKDDKWVIFNDEKVALSETPPTQHAYLYLFQRIDSIGSPNPSY